MSTSSSAARRKIEPAILAFPYQEVSEGGGASIQEGLPWSSQQDHQQREEAAHAAGVSEGEARAHATYESQIQRCRSGLAEALKHFADDRKKYFLTVEHEVVQLALNIARKILRREAQIDSNLLAGMVRVCLEQAGQNTQVTVRTHPEQVSALRTFFAREMSENPPQVLEDATLGLNSCVLETALGTTEIGPEVQLKEIEQGLLDLQSATPR
jgi:flagellar assembly protein FliH